MLERLYDRTRQIDGDETGPATHVLIVAVPRYAALFDQQDLTSAIYSYHHLARFWRRAADASNPRRGFVPTPAVATVRGAQLSVDETSRGRALSASILAYLRQLGPGDFLIVHWIGHGSFLRRYNDHLLYLPNLQSPDDMETLEAVWLTRLTTWVGANCRASTQVFLLDCCSTEPDAAQSLPEQFPRFVDNPECGPKQAIIVGSGVGRVARGRDNEPSVFTNSIIGALNGYAAGDDGVVATGRHFVTALASVAKADWLVRNFPAFPRRVLTRGSFDWTQDFVQEVQPFCRHFAAQQDMIIGLAAAARVHCCLTYRDQGCRLRSPNVEAEGEVRLTSYRYVDESDHTTALWAWIGDVSPGREICATLKDEGRIVGRVSCRANKAVVSGVFE